MIQEHPEIELSNGKVIPSMIYSEGKNYCCLGECDTGKSEYYRFLLGLSKDFSKRAIQLESNPNEIGYIPTNPFHLFSAIKSTLRGELELSDQFLNREIVIDFDFLEMLGIHHLIDQNPFSFSGGEAVKAAIAIVNAKKPRVWILDQIFDQLSPDTIRIIRSFVNKQLENGCVVHESHTKEMPWFSKYDRVLVFSKDNKLVNKIHSNDSTQDIKLFLSWTPEKKTKLVSKFPTDIFKITKEIININLSEERIFNEKIQKKSMIEMTDCFFKYQNSNFRLEEISVDFESNNCTSIVGSNGAGKTTLLNMISGIVQPIKGNVKYNKIIPKDQFEWASSILYSFQNPDHQLNLSTVLEELFETSRILNVEANNPYWLIHQFNLENELKSAPFALPLSVRRLVIICSLFIASPPFIALDEPTASLDPFQVQALITVIKRYIKEGGGIVCISHDYEFLGEISNRVVALDNGKIVSDGLSRNWPKEYEPYALGFSRTTASPVTSLNELVFRLASQHQPNSPSDSETNDFNDL